MRPSEKDQGDTGGVELVVVSDEMRAAGIERATELMGEPDLGYLVSAIYLAMEYQRLDSLGQLSRFGQEALKVRQG